MDNETKKRAEALRKEISESQEILKDTTDPKEKIIIQKAIDIDMDNLKKLESEMEKPAEKKTVVKKTIEAKPEKQKKPAKVKSEKKPKLAKVKKGKPEKTVKISKVIPDDEKSKVKDILEKEYYKVIIKEVGGKKVKISVKHSDKTVAKNKIESAFITVSKNVNSDEEKKKYADDLKVLSNIESTFKNIIESIYAAFNKHDTEALKKILEKLK